MEKQNRPHAIKLARSLYNRFMLAPLSWTQDTDPIHTTPELAIVPRMPLDSFAKERLALTRPSLS